MKGFGARYTSNSRNYVVQPTWNGIRPRLTIGPVGVFPFEGPPNAPGARDIAIAAIAAARRGDDPRHIVEAGRRREGKKPEGVTLNELWAAYAAAGFPKLRRGKTIELKRASTVKADSDRYARYLKPKIGSLSFASFDDRSVSRWLDNIPSDGQRSQCLTLFKTIQSFALSRGLVPGVARSSLVAAKSREVQNFYTSVELAQLDAAIVRLVAERPTRVLVFAALRLLLMTGARRGEICALRWRDVDLDHGAITLEQDKVSDNRRDILLRPEAVALLDSLPRTNSPFVFPADSKTGHVYWLETAFAEAVEAAGLRRVRLHDLRHSFAAASIRGGNSLYATGKLLGHRQAQTTSRYAHLEHDVARAALERIAAQVKLDEVGNE